MPEESPACRAPSHADSELSGPESPHPEDLFTPAQVSAGTVNVSVSGYCYQLCLIGCTRCPHPLHLISISCNCGSSFRDIPPKPDLVSAVARRPGISSSKQLLSRQQILPLKVSTHDILTTQLLWKITVHIRCVTGYCYPAACTGGSCVRI